MKSVPANYPQRIWKYLYGNKVHHYLLLALLPVLVYFHTLKFGYSGFDDEEIIAKKISFIGKIENIPQVFKQDAFMNTKGDSFYRPVGNISFMIDAILGGENLSVFHAHNLILHIVSLILALYLFTIMGLDRRVSFVVLMIMSVHPLFTHAICWIPARMDLLLAVFSISALILWAKYINTGKSVFLISHICFFFLAVFVKETAMLLPVIFGLYYYFVGGRKWKDMAIRFLPAWISIITAYLFMRFQVLQSQTGAGIFNLGLMFHNLLVIPVFIAKFILPFGLTTMPRFQMTFVVLGMILSLGIIFYLLKNRKQENAFLVFGFIWYILFSLPPTLYTNPMSRFGFDYLEHRAYVPMLGIAILIVAAIRERRIFPASMRVILVFLVAGFSAISYANSFNYSSPLEFYSAAIRENPDCAIAYNSRSLYKFSNGDPIGAENDLNESLAITPDYAPAWNNKAALFLQLKEYDSAVVFVNRAIKLNSAYAEAYTNRAIAKNNLGDLSGAVQDYKKSLSLDPNTDYIYYNLGNVYAYQGLYTEAVKQYSKALILNPKYLEALNNRANINLRLKRFQNALDDCTTLINYNPDYQRAYFNKAKALMGLGEYSTALEAVDKAIQIDSTFTAAIEYRSQIIQKRP